MSMAQDESDKDLIESALSGKQQAFRELLIRYQDMAFSIARQLMPSEADAEDMVQEGFTKAFRSLHKFEGRAKFSTWLYSIIYNTGLSKLRKKNLFVDHRDAEDYTKEAIDDNTLNGYASLKSEQRKMFVQAAMNNLEEIDRTLLTFYYFEERNLREIGKIIGCDENTAKVKLFRARKKMEKSLSHILKDELKSIL